MSDHRQSSSGASTAWHFKHARRLREASARHRLDCAKPMPCGLKPAPFGIFTPRAGSAEWHSRQVSSRWQEAQLRMLRLAWNEWLLGRGVEMTSPAASRAQPGG